MEAVPEAAAEPASQQSPLLRCLAQLNDDVLTAHLLPKLVEQGSAGAVVLACSQLRRLLQPSIQHLDLTKQLQEDPCHSPVLARQLLAAFPNCTSLNFAWASSSMPNIYRSISPLLAGLPHLSTISIKLGADSQEGELDPVLALMQVHAAGVQSLSLQIGTSWTGDAAASTWAVLGKMVSLTKLQLSFTDEVHDPCGQHNLQLLTRLSNLQSLCVAAPGADVPDNGLERPPTPELCQFPGRLTTLTELQLPLDVLRDISSMGECANLRDLQLHAPWEYATVGLTKEEWAALLQLTQLTCLKVEAVIGDVTIGGPENAEEAFLDVLRQLRGLRVVGAHVWTIAALPVLQSLTNVTAVYGAWDLGEGVDLNGLASPHIRELGRASGSIPWQVLPNLTSLTLETDCVENQQALCTCCTGLQRLVFYPPTDHYVRDQHAEYVSAFASLAKLQHLTHLELSAVNDAEFMAFTSAAAAANTLQLQYLRMHAPYGMLTVVTLMKVRGVQELRLDVSTNRCWVVGGSIPADAARGLLVGLAHVPKVSLVLCTEQQRSVVEAARQWAADMGLPLPAVLKVSVSAPKRH